MVFTSVNFLLFFVSVFLLYWFACGKNVKAQNGLLLLASYFFYGFASLKIVPILLLATVVFYYLGIAIEHAYETMEDEQAMKIGGRWTTLGVVLGVGFLLYFKYFNFFVGSFVDMLNLFGLSASYHTLKIIMPLGISFFTFKLIAYVLDINHGKIHAERDMIQFATYIAFFPTLLSGPIDRPVFMKQLKKLRTFDYDMAASGCRQFLWGFFKKVVVADNCATYVDSAWLDIAGSSASTLVLAAVLYAFELYADFSGYSDMAIGVGKLLGLKVTENFRTPFYALNIADFWRRWHMSLTSWMTDYVFMPLNLKMRTWGKWGVVVAIIINFLVVGIWHGDNWIYAAYGLYHGLLFIPLILSGAFMRNEQIRTLSWSHDYLPVPRDFMRMLCTFVLVAVGFLIFRADSMSQFGQYIVGMCNSSILTMPKLFLRSWYIPTFITVAVMLVVEWVNRHREYGLELSNVRYATLRWGAYMVLIATIFVYGKFNETFIYFQF